MHLVFLKMIIFISVFDFIVSGVRTWTPDTRIMIPLLYPWATDLNQWLRPFVDVLVTIVSQGEWWWEVLENNQKDTKHMFDVMVLKPLVAHSQQERMHDDLQVALTHSFNHAESSNLARSRSHNTDIMKNNTQILRQNHFDCIKVYTFSNYSDNSWWNHLFIVFSLQNG